MELFRDLRTEGIVQTNPQNTPIVDISLCEIDNNVITYSVSIWQPPQTFDLFGHPAIDRNLQVYDAKKLLPLQEYGKEFLKNLTLVIEPMEAIEFGGKRFEPIFELYARSSNTI